jgi:hypothetical protein
VESAMNLDLRRRVEIIESVPGRYTEQFEQRMKQQSKLTLSSLEMSDTLPSIEIAQRIVVPSSVRNAFIERGDYWLVRFDGVEKSFKDSKGLEHIHTLLQNQGQQVPVLAFYPREGASPKTAEICSSPSILDDMGVSGDVAVPDRTADTQVYGKAIEKLKQDYESAVSEGNPDKAIEVGSQIDELKRILNAEYGRNGYERSKGDPVEKARKAVSAAIARAIKRIESNHEALGQHLKRTIETGRICTYNPSEHIDWET